MGNSEVFSPSNWQDGVAVTCQGEAVGEAYFTKEDQELCFESVNLRCLLGCLG